VLHLDEHATRLSAYFCSTEPFGGVCTWPGSQGTDSQSKLQRVYRLAGRTELC
jgi:hypothetical protein